MKYTTGEKDCLQRLQSLQTRVLTMSINEISEEVHYSPATINRVLKKLGYSNIKAYKKYMQANFLTSDNDHIVYEEYYKSLHNLLDFDFTNQFTILNQWLEIYECSHIVGIDASSSAAISLNSGFSINDYQSELCTSSGIFHAFAEKTTKNRELIIVCTISCSDIYLQTSIEMLAQKGLDIKIVIITTNPKAEICKKCDLVIGYDTLQYDRQYRVSTALTIIIHKLLESIKA